MIEAIFGVIGTIIGTILGFVLSERATRQQEKRTEKRQIRAVRTLLSLEIDQNLALLRDFWSKVKQVDEPEPDSERAHLRLAHRLIKLPLSHWSHSMWESQRSLLAVALSEEEVRQVYDLHNRLDAITAIRSTLSTWKSKQHEDRKSVRTESGMIPMALTFALAQEFDRNAPELWIECEQIVREVLDKGNPL